MEKHLNLVVPVYHSSTMVHVAEKYFVPVSHPLLPHAHAYTPVELVL